MCNNSVFFFITCNGDLINYKPRNACNAKLLFITFLFLSFVCHFWQWPILIKWIKCYCLCDQRWLVRPILPRSAKLPVADRTREVWVRKLFCWSLNSGFPLCTFLFGFADSFCFVFTVLALLLMMPRHFVRSCAICSVGMLKSLRWVLRVSFL